MSSGVIGRDRSNRFFSAPTLFVAGVWIVMLTGAVGFLVRFAVNVPFAEDGMLIPYVTGDEPLTSDFLWCEYASHIIPLPKLLLVLLARSTHDFRTSMYVSVLTCAVVALALTFAAKSLRGRFDYTDAFFAIGLLHLGHWESFLIGFAIQEVMSTALLAIILLVMLSAGTSLTAKQSLAVGLCLVLLPSTGTAGCLLVPPLAIWLAYSAWLRWRTNTPGAASAAAFQLILVVAALACLTPYYFSIPRGMLWYREPASVAEKARAIFAMLMQLLTLGFGRGASSAGLPFFNEVRSSRLVGSVILGLSVLSLVLLFFRRLPPEELLRKVGLSLFLLANLLVLAAIAFGRCGISTTAGLSPRYSLYSVPLLWGIFFIWQLYGVRLDGRMIPVGLFTFMCAMFSLNLQLGYDAGVARHGALKAAEHDLVRSDIPAHDIVTLYNQYINSDIWVCYKLRGRSGGQSIIRSEGANMVNMLRAADIPKVLHLDPAP